MRQSLPFRALLAVVLALTVSGPAQALPILRAGFEADAGWRTFRLPERDDDVACSGTGNASAQIGRVYVAQTHLMEATHPFFFLAANRPALLKVDVTGNGVAPEVAVTGRVDGRDLGTLCLAGPANLPAAVDPEQQSFGNSFTVTLPSAWMRVGLSLRVRAGSAVRELDAASLKLGPEPILTLLAMDMLLFGDTTPGPRPPNWEMGYLSSMPFSAMHVGSLVTFSIPELPIGPRSNGQTPNGVITPMPATIATTPSRCSSSDRPLGLCTPWVGFAVLGEARRLLEKVSRANGLHGINYGTVGDVIGGGIAGSNYGTGDDLGATFNHENGHSMGMPHWGDDWYGRQAATDVQKHPYAGTQITSLFESAQFLGKGAEPLGGGYGNSWGYDTVSHSLISPMCPAVNRERQEPMQRGGPRCEVNQVTTHDWFSDYSSLYAFRYAVGYGQPYSGTVPYPRDPLGNANVPFGYPATGGGRLNVIAPNSEQPQLLRWDHTTARYVDVREGVSQGLLDHRHASASNVPVVTIWGSFSTTTPAANTIMPPLRYIGNLMRTWDPNSPADFTSMKSVVSGEAFWWGADLVVRVDYRDGLRRQAVVKVAPRGTDPLNGNSFDMWAVNFPDDRPIARISLFHRPMEVRNSGDTNPRNINFTGSTTTAANYLDGAPIVATRVIPQ